MTSRRFAALTVLLALAGTITMSADFDPTDALFFLGVVAVLLAAMGGVCWYFAGKRGHLDDAFEAGYRAGLHKGQRIRPRVIRLERDQEPSSRQ